MGPTINGAVSSRSLTGPSLFEGSLLPGANANGLITCSFTNRSIPIALIEAKKNTKPVGAGMQQGLEYADHLDVPFVFSSNGDGFVLHDRTARSTPQRNS